mmetsp:Transcript_14793/g.20989  ORF Transcript_14793/g.20989 Transcript_14793/m.20989 type:complete len:324 (-) Transcript_14793:305-1276(-)|eukprot:CAMPEP_0201699696 /NCGR_PEP_ID=MMETSP0578-20130828/25120_1 /ASSEMBLY_ACC=CAM_ASM_000663 /TAXON_ID=267565 /ORGANISM="Skeletonema grethea, Strain CCMP 1804" /LENGTH=323 /DNA_ID=CAMNT_0048186529 /DNA_START=8 /DNA_END=979 /DNA_ORIENTATION=-
MSAEIESGASSSLLANQPLSPTTIDSAADDNVSVSSNSSSKSEERRRRRELWRREHEKQLKVDGHFPRRNSSDGSVEEDRKAVAARVVKKSHLGTKSTASPHTLPTKVSDSVRVRSNLLRTLGIQKGPPPKDDGAMGGPSGSAGRGGRGNNTHLRRSIQSGDVSSGADSVAPSTAVSSRSLLSNVRLTEELKYDSDEDAEPYPNGAKDAYSRFFGSKQSRSFDSKPNKNNENFPRRRKLMFSDDVQVVPIPMRSEYSNRIKERMYNGRVELSENAQRNVVEFEAEGWDASTVLDDESQFYKCPLTGELIHPVHLAYFKGDSKE